MDVLLNINDLCYMNLFSDLNMYIEKNTLNIVSGPNNCGKTTLMRILDRSINTETNIIIHGKEISEYKDSDYSNILQVVFPNRIIFHEKYLLDELKIQTEEIDNDKIEYLLSKLNLKKSQNKDISQLTEKEIILTQIAIAILNTKEIVAIDELDNYFDDKELIKLYKVFKEIIKEYDLTFIITSINLNPSIYSDNIFIIHNGKVVLKGEPLRVLDKDNILNKIGLNIPFIIDLSVKLRDYDLLNEIKLNQESLIDKLWK